MQPFTVLGLVDANSYTVPHAAGGSARKRRRERLQYIAAGHESIGYAPVDGLTVTQPYAEERDCMFLSGDGDFLAASAGTFFVFFPEDAHMPGLTNRQTVTVRKVVVKVRTCDGA